MTKGKGEVEVSSLKQAPKDLTRAKRVKIDPKGSFLPILALLSLLGLA